MQQTNFSRQRDNLIKQYHLRIQPFYQEYQKSLADNKYTIFQAKIKPYLEELFGQIAKLKQEVIHESG